MPRKPISVSPESLSPSCPSTSMSALAILNDFAFCWAAHQRGVPYRPGHQFAAAALPQAHGPSGLRYVDVEILARSCFVGEPVCGLAVAVGHPPSERSAACSNHGSRSPKALSTGSSYASRRCLPAGVAMSTSSKRCLQAEVCLRPGLKPHRRQSTMKPC